MNPTPGPLVLASASPRRRELLTQIGVGFEIIVHDLDESLFPGESPVDYVCRLARAKALAVSQNDLAVKGRPVLGADTIVVIDDLVLGKPSDEHDAHRMLSLLSGREHEVMTAVCICQGEQSALELSRTYVTFKPMSAAEISSYWRSGEPQGKAGAYAVQGLGALFIESLHGSYSGVVGLPIYETARLLTAFGITTALDRSGLIE
ncbi:septum formation inhibitor Maf [Gammaproteobacteria bacterium LSUCC0112]|nr:septum formation inhibitor Maf [Gammaproteobacteria bacterium LSUCC0112]